MATTVSQWRIDGKHPAEYAGTWGDTTNRDGVLFYNCSDVDRYTGETIAREDWTGEDWFALAQAARRQSAKVLAEIRTGEGRNRTGWCRKDARNLERLAEWAVLMAYRARSTSPWVRRTM